MTHTLKSSQQLRSELPAFASTLDEIRIAVERNAVRRGIFLMNSLQALEINNLLRRVAELSSTYDREEWFDKAEIWSINPAALDILDNHNEDPIPYPVFFCSPSDIVCTPQLLSYYRNLAMLSNKAMRDIELSTEKYELGLQTISFEHALILVQYLNSTISNILLARSTITPHLAIEMLYTNIGDSLGGAWRNEIGRIAYVEVLSPLIVHLYQLDRLAYVKYITKGQLTHIEDETLSRKRLRSQMLDISQVNSSDSLHHVLNELHINRVKYQEIGLRNGNRLCVDRQVTWILPSGKKTKFGSDLLAEDPQFSYPWAAELKGGADPAGSDEHWKTAVSAFDRILLACEQMKKSPPRLTFMATIIVDRVAVEAATRIREGKLSAVYNLTQIAESDELQKQFLDDLTRFLHPEAET